MGGFFGNIKHRFFYSGKFILSALIVFICLWLSQRVQADPYVEHYIDIIRPGETIQLSYYCEYSKVPKRWTVRIDDTRVAEFAGTGVTVSGKNVFTSIRGVKRGTTTVTFLDYYSHAIYAEWKIVSANYTRYVGGPKYKGSSLKNYGYYSKASISGNKLKVTGRLQVSKDHSGNWRFKRLKNKTFRLTKKTMYIGYEEKGYSTYNKSTIKKMLGRYAKGQGIGTVLYVERGKVILIGELS